MSQPLIKNYSQTYTGTVENQLDVEQNDVSTDSTHSSIIHAMANASFRNILYKLLMDGGAAAVVVLSL
jgi:hypothetical protein